jgi:hypothetical protein
MGGVPDPVPCEAGDVVGEPQPAPGGNAAAGRLWRKRVDRVRAARVAAEGAQAELVAATVEAVRSGALSQVWAAREAGVDRHTVRGWLGLPRRRPGRHAASG